MFQYNRPAHSKEVVPSANQAVKNTAQLPAVPALQRKENKTGMPDNLKAGVENLSGFSMDDVKVHYNSAQPAQLNALAYAQGTDIHIAPGQEKHLPHEAWHVAQQKQGRVQATMQMKENIPVNDDAGLEQEADKMGAAALQAGNNISTEKSGGIKQFQPQKGYQATDNSNSRKVVQSFKPLSNVVQRTISVQHSAHNENDGRATHVEAIVYGETLGIGANQPTVYPDGWKGMKEKYEMDDVFRLHLWNGRLGGTGNQKWNLTPGVREVNDEMTRHEVNAQAAVDRGRLVFVETNVTYGHANEPEYYYPTDIKYKWFAQNRNGSTVDSGSWQTNVPLPDEKDADFDPNNPYDLGVESYNDDDMDDSSGN